MFPTDSKILIIDDMITMRKLVRKTFFDLGFTNVTEAADGQLGWGEVEKAIGEKAPFSLVVSDWNMPNMTGLDLLKKVRADERLKGLPFILVTAETEMPQVMEAIKAGVTTYVTKPFPVATFKEKLQTAWDKK
jgi:two-component system chemotaxis response regulator CheY